MGKDLQIMKENKKGFKRFLLSFKYGYEGFKYAFYHEKNMIYIMIGAIVALLLGIILDITYVEKLVVIVLIVLNMCVELINTSIEKLVDLAGKRCDDAKVAEDAAGGAVAVAMIFSLVIGLFIYIPKIIELLGGK